MNNKLNNPIEITLGLAVEVLKCLDAEQRKTHLGSHTEKVYFKLRRALEAQGVVFIEETK